MNVETTTVITVISLLYCGVESLAAMTKSDDGVWPYGCPSNTSSSVSSFYLGDDDKGDDEDNVISCRDDPNFSSAENVLVVVRCQGTDGAANEVLYFEPLVRGHGKVLGNVIFWPGDVQDLHHRM